MRNEWFGFDAVSQVVSAVILVAEPGWEEIAEYVTTWLKQTVPAGANGTTGDKS